MDTVDVILEIAETVLQDAKKETITMNLLSVSNNLFCGSLSLLVGTEAVSTFPTPFKPPAEPSLKRKPVNTGGSSPIKVSLAAGHTAQYFPEACFHEKSYRKRRLQKRHSIICPSSFKISTHCSSVIFPVTSELGRL